MQKVNSSQQGRTLPQVRHIIAVASGKGGVGKSTVALHLSLALSQLGKKVGLLDADIYGPSQPTLLGTHLQKPEIEENYFIPISALGLKTMSIGYLVEAQAALAWRGPMLGKALEQMVFDTAWGELDYLILDLPPGTGDVQLTVCQKIPLEGAVIITTPQDLALSDVKRACAMFDKLSIPVLGVIENMSIFHCPACGHAMHVFGKGGGEILAKDKHYPFLGAIPLDLELRQKTDAGLALTLQGTSIGNSFLDIAKALLTELNARPKTKKFNFPKIVVEPQEKPSS